MLAGGDLNGAIFSIKNLNNLEVGFVQPRKATKVRVFDHFWKSECT